MSAPEVSVTSMKNLSPFFGCPSTEILNSPSSNRDTKFGMDSPLLLETLQEPRSALKIICNFDPTKLSLKPSTLNELAPIFAAAFCTDTASKLNKSVPRSPFKSKPMR